MHRLEREGRFSRPQAEALSKAFHEAAGETVATKEDVNLLRVELKLWTGGLAVAVIAALGTLMTPLKVYGH